MTQTTEQLTSVISASGIRNLNIAEMDVMSLDYQYMNDRDNYFICINGERTLNFAKSSDRKKSFDKIKRMGLGYGWVAPQLTDEEEGIIQAAKNGENPFAYTIICANPAMNERVPVK